ncbi:aryl-sulfate sulfotransferase [Phocaeicola sartorii]|uniref:aryl-sulfate sulfotransferase n=1 Tax=Phocaeicola sartorii TaxID=671267 RepID=UPI00242B2B7F|nr:aryl-sulfate sulfotransferase [Phocaeicola sartorii]
MKIKWVYLLGCFLWIMTACNENEDIEKFSENCKELYELLQTEDCLLKDIVSTPDTYTFKFEKTNVILNVSDVLSIDMNREQWKTILTLADESTIEIPTLGNSLEALVDFVKVNPSGYNPLVATVRLNLPCSGAFRVGVCSKEGSVTPKQEHTYGYTSMHTQFLTVLGLYADYINKVELTLLNKEGEELISSVIEIKTEPLNIRYLPEIRVTKALIDKMEPGMNMIACPGQGEGDLSIPFMADADGEVRWVLDWSKCPDMQHFAAQCGAHPMKNGNYVLADWNFHKIVEVDVLGNIVHKWDLEALGYEFHHEIMEGQNGNFLIAASRKDAKLLDGTTRRIFDFILEFNPDMGKITNEWDLGGMLDKDRLCFLDDGGFGRQDRGNWLHNNGVTEYGKEDLLITARWQGVIKFGRKSNKVQWILAPHKGWGTAWQGLLLQPLDKSGQPITNPDVINGLKPHPDFEWIWGPHCPVVLPNGHIMVFDNGYNREFVTKLSNGEDLYSRAVEYEIDEDNMTVRQVWQYGKELGRSGYAAAISGVAYLPQTKHRLFCPGMLNCFADGKTGGRVVEVDASTGEVVFEMEMPVSGMGAFHRASRMPLYPRMQ